MIFAPPSAMPTHWESSERPLFVRTVVVNGSRHAILSHVDPLCQARKSDSSPECLEPNREEINPRRVRTCYPSKRDISSELQNCLVKLRVVLSTQEQRRRLKMDATTKDEEESRENWKRVRESIKKSHKSGMEELNNKEDKLDDITGFIRGNRYCSAIRKRDFEDNSEDTERSNLPQPEIEHPADNVPKMSERTNVMRTFLPLSESTEELLRNYSSYFFPIVYIKAEDVTWEDFAGDGTVSKNANNPLSERVMQWLELARRRKESMDSEKSKSSPQNLPAKQTNQVNADNRKYKSARCRYKGLAYQIPDEDVEDEVKQESDIETVLSSSTHEYPKYSRELNKLHMIKNDFQHKPSNGMLPSEDYWENILSIPEKTTSDYSLTEQLQQSILESFEAIVNLERKVALERKEKTHSSRKKSLRDVRTSTGRTSRKKSLLLKQTSIRISSDEEDASGSFLNRRRVYNLGKRSGHSNGKKSWNFHGPRVMSANEDRFEPSEESGREVRIIYNETPLKEKNNGGRRVWESEKGANKLHLHIFMPGINSKFLEAHDQESASDTESIVK